MSVPGFMSTITLAQLDEMQFRSRRQCWAESRFDTRVTSTKDASDQPSCSTRGFALAAQPSWKGASARPHQLLAQSLKRFLLGTLH